MLKTLRRMSWRGRRNQKENRKSRKLRRSPKHQKSQKRRVLKGMYERSPASLYLYIYTYAYISVHCYVNISFQREKKEKEPKEPKKRGRKPTVHYDDEGNPVEKESKPKRQRGGGPQLGSSCMPSSCPSNACFFPSPKLTTKLVDTRALWWTLIQNACTLWSRQQMWALFFASFIGLPLATHKIEPFASKGRLSAQIWMFFWKSSEGEGVGGGHFRSKKLHCKFCWFQSGIFWS